MPAKLALAVCLFVEALAAQVSISVNTTKTEYLQGEPIIVLIEVENNGMKPLPYGRGCDFDIRLSIEKENPEPLFPAYGCFRGYGGGIGGCWGIDHPPYIEPGKSVTFKRLLKGYRLGPGRYTIQAQGHALSEKDLAGNQFSKRMGIQILPAVEQDLRNVYAPLLEAAQRSISDDLPYREREEAANSKAIARQAISEMAPPFLEDLIKSFAHDDPALAVGGLARMNTLSSRRALADLFQHSSDKDLRQDIAAELAHIGAPDQFDFFSQLLLGEHASADAKIQSAAIEGIGRIGSEEAVQVLAGFHSGNLELNDDAIYALGLTRSRHAVSILIERSSAFSASSDWNSVCGSLATLTHRQWCDVPAENRVQYWRDWWSSHEAEVGIYGDDHCDGALNARPIS